MFVWRASDSQEELLLALLGADAVGGGEPLARHIDHGDLSLGRPVLGVQCHGCQGSHPGCPGGDGVGGEPDLRGLAEAAGEGVEGAEGEAGEGVLQGTWGTG